MSNTIIDSLKEVLPHIKHIVKEDMGLSIVDNEKYIFVDQPETFTLNVKPGDLLQSDSKAFEAMKTGKSSVSIVPKEVFGVTILGGFYPIFDSKGEYVCGVAIAKNIEHRQEVETASKTIFSSLQQANSSVEEIAANSQSLVTSMENITSCTNISSEKINEIDSLLEAIQSISSQSKFLAINASIEAARAGDIGRGFSVVANEMKKLSSHSKEFAESISKTLLEIRQSIDDIIKEVEATSLIADSQAAATEEVTATIEEITSSSEVLAEKAKTV